MPNPYLKLACLCACLTVMSCNYSSSDAHLKNGTDSIATKSDTSRMAELMNKKPDTVYRSFFSEDTLKHGYYFGMTLSEWNRQLALLTKSGLYKELSEIGLDQGENIVNGSYKAFYSEDTSRTFNRNRDGFFVFGLFKRPTIKSDTLVIFKRGGKIVNEPVLIGLKYQFHVPYDKFREIIEIVVGKDHLRYLAGPDPILPTNEPLTISDFSDPVYEALQKGLSSQNPTAGKEQTVTNKSETNTLFEGRKFYSVISVQETDEATATRNIDYKIASLTNQERYYTLSQMIYSKQQADLRISDYMTETQKKNYDNSSETKRLIDKALK